MTDYNNLSALNYSGAKALLRSPAHYIAWLNAEQVDSPALRLGRIVHLAVLDPKAYIEKVKVGPEVDRRTKDGKAQWEAFKAALPADAEIVDPDTYASANAIASSGEMALASLKPEHGKLWQTETPLSKQVDGVAIKGRPDLVTFVNGEKVVIDLKTTQDASARSFGRDVHNFMYHMQAAFYLELTGATKFLLVAVEKEAPHAWRVYELDEASVAEGRRLMAEAVATYKNCLAFGQWPAYPKEVEVLSLPKYAFSQTQ